MDWKFIGIENGDYRAEIVFPFDLKAYFQEGFENGGVFKVERNGFKLLKVLEDREDKRGLMSVQTHWRDDGDSNNLIIDELIITFRPHDDQYTWGRILVRPGEPAMASFTLKASAVKDEVLMGKIILEAEQSLEWKFLKLFEIYGCVQ